MSYRCVIVDDEKPARDRVKRLLADHPDFECVGQAHDADSAVRLIDESRPDLCFLDVQMPEGDGFSVLERVKKMPAVVFTTAYDEYAVRAFDVRSLDYLLKPFDKRRFAEALERARKMLQQPAIPAEQILELLEEFRRGPDPARISGKRGTKILLLDPADVLCFEAEDTLVFARTADGRALVERTLSELEHQLPGFFRAHRSCLVNISAIAEIVPAEGGLYNIVLADEKRTGVPLSRRQARRLRELIPW